MTTTGNDASEIAGRSAEPKTCVLTYAAGNMTQIVDRTEFQIQSNVLEDNLLNRVMGDLDALLSERDQRVREGIERAMRQRLFEESEGFGARSAEARSSGCPLAGRLARPSVLRHQGKPAIMAVSRE